MIDKRLYNFSGSVNKYISLTTILSCIKLIANIFFYAIFAFLFIQLHLHNSIYNFYRHCQASFYYKICIYAWRVSCGSKTKFKKTNF